MRYFQLRRQPQDESVICFVSVQHTSKTLMLSLWKWLLLSCLPILNVWSNSKLYFKMRMISFNLSGLELFHYRVYCKVQNTKTLRLILPGFSRDGYGSLFTAEMHYFTGAGVIQANMECYMPLASVWRRDSKKVYDRPYVLPSILRLSLIMLLQCFLF